MRRRHAGRGAVAEPGPARGPVVLRRYAGLPPGDDLSRRRSGGGGHGRPRAADQAGAGRGRGARRHPPAVRAPGPVRQWEDRAAGSQRDPDRDPPGRPGVRAAPDPTCPGGAAAGRRRLVEDRSRRHALPRPDPGTPGWRRDRLPHPHSGRRAGAGHGALPHRHFSAHLLLPRLVPSGLRGSGTPVPPGSGRLRDPTLADPSPGAGVLGQRGGDRAGRTRRARDHHRP